MGMRSVRNNWDYGSFIQSRIFKSRPGINKCKSWDFHERFAMIWQRSQCTRELFGTDFGRIGRKKNTATCAHPGASAMSKPANRCLSLVFH
eukprot:1346752-Amorphochlora_amoeboformis.AAC.2